MPTLNIKDPEVYRLAKQLAAQRSTSATGAVREALREALDRDATHRDARTREGMADRLLALGRRSAARPERFVVDEDLYDERGLPR
ncbi:MAG: type II toxin-antitoxin system VapB family antitoxin [Austwickia sp.]|nr:type II toxin-antitoxin system VapB family antitoxin [Austwickia sp.]MBK8437257.1 type II toxin-antitoxin system VapB family antitoxin [Austwickia sp.]MBK9102490.1 type II toxin-antitoxin system VapB family antitoxin [Austwickia sp.]